MPKSSGKGKLWSSITPTKILVQMGDGPRKPKSSSLLMVKLGDSTEVKDNMLLKYEIGKPSSKAVLTQSDLTYVGSFRLPYAVGAYNTPWGAGLALRRVGEEVRIFSTGYASGTPNYYPLYEVVVPASLDPSGIPSASYIASLSRNWGDVFADPMANDRTGLFWDETDQRLYCTGGGFGGYITTGDPYAPTMGFVTLNDTEGTAEYHGDWGFTSRSLKMANTGFLAIPSDFASAYLSGKRLGVGFGGSQSGWTFGPASLGPALTAFSPPALGTEDTNLANTPLMGYPATTPTWTSGDRPTVDRCWRDDDVLCALQSYGFMADPDTSLDQSHGAAATFSGDETMYWQGYSAGVADYYNYPASLPGHVNVAIGTKHWASGNSFWNNDYIHQCGAWVQTPTKEGVVFIGTLSTGFIYYVGGQPSATGHKHQLMIYSRDQMVSVVEGADPTTIQPTRSAIEFEGMSYPLVAFGGVPHFSARAIAYDSVAQRIYVAVQFASEFPNDGTYVVYVYQVS
jgi:hypothetical protein